MMGLLLQKRDHLNYYGAWPLLV